MERQSEPAIVTIRRSEGTHPDMSFRAPGQKHSTVNSPSLTSSSRLGQNLCRRSMEMITSHLFRCYSAQTWRSSDLTIVCEDGSLQAHRLVLAAASPQFLKPLLSEDFQRGDQQQSHLICPEIKTSEMAQVLALIYTGAFVLRARKEDQPATEYEDCVDLVATLGIPIEEFVLEKVPRSMTDEINVSIQDKTTSIQVLGSKASNPTLATSSVLLNKRASRESDLEPTCKSFPLLRRNLQRRDEREREQILLEPLRGKHGEEKKQSVEESQATAGNSPMHISATAIISKRYSGQITHGAGGALLIVQYKRGQGKLNRLALELDNNNGQGKNSHEKVAFESPRDCQGHRNESSSIIDELANPIPSSVRVVDKRYAILTPQSSITSLYSNCSSTSDFESGIGSDTASSIGEEENPSNTNLSQALSSEHTNASSSLTPLSHIQVKDPFAGLNQGSVNPCLLTNDDSIVAKSCRMSDDSDLNTAMETNSNVEEDIQYKCELCGERFRLLEFLQHQTLHKDDAPYQCSNENCLRKFKTQSEFRAHRRVAHKSLASSSKTPPGTLVTMSLGLGQGGPTKAPSSGNSGTRPDEQFKAAVDYRGPIAACFSSQERKNTSPTPASPCTTSGNFICPFCSTSFQNLGLLHTHLHTHAGSDGGGATSTITTTTNATTTLTKINLNSNSEKLGANETGVSAMRSKTHAPIHYQCHLCPRHDFKSPDELKSHLIEHKLPKSLAKGIFTCRMCSTAHVTWEVFSQHFLATHGSVPRVVLKYKCVPCGLSFNSRSDYLTHNSMKHSTATVGTVQEEANNFACSTEKTTTGTVSANGSNNQAKISDSDFPNSHTLKTLIISGKEAINAEKSEDDVDCQVCYRSHVKGLACIPRKQCEICRTLFKSAKSYKRHMDQCHRSNGPKHFCKICSRAFKRSDNLAAHYRAVHYGVKPNKCADCGKGYRTKNELAKHNGTCHKPNPTIPHLGLIVSPLANQRDQQAEQKQQQQEQEQQRHYQRLSVLGQFEPDPSVIYQHEGVGQGNNDGNNDDNNDDDSHHRNNETHHHHDIINVSDSPSCMHLSSSSETLLNDEERLASKYLNDVILNRDDAAEDDDDTDDLLNHMKPHFEDMGDFDDIFKATTQSLVGSI